jgi:predicted phosphodiesterase
MVDEGGVNKRGVEAATVAGNRDMDKLKAIQGDDEDEKENADRRLMVHGNLVGEVLEDEEEEFVFEEGAPEEGLLMGWFAVARYYSGHNLPVKVIFSDLF